MHKIYLLLRDNKQSGPFDLGELLQLSLKPLDLIWVDGKSMGWQYPGEIEALKPYLPEAPKEQPINIVTSPGPELIPSTITQATLTTGKKPEVPSAKHIFVSFPAIAANGAQVQNKPEESEEDKLERKAEEIKARVQAFAEANNELEEIADPNTGYARSLRDIKAEYNLWLYQQQKKNKRWSKYKKGLLAAVLVLIFALAGFFSGRKVLNVLSKIPQTVALYLTPRRELATHQREKEKNNKKEKETSILVKNTTIPDLPPPLFSKAGDTTNNKNELPVIFPQKSAVKKMTAAGHRISPGTGAHDKSGKAIVNTSEKPAETTIIKSEQQPVNSAPVSPSVPSGTASVFLPKLVEVSDINLSGGEKNGSAEPQLTVQNHSDQLLNTVVIDVYYYKGKKLLGKKMIYFDNIPPQSSLTLPLPKQKKADTTNYHVGLISSKSGVYYLR